MSTTTEATPVPTSAAVAVTLTSRAFALVFTCWLLRLRSVRVGGVVSLGELLTWATAEYPWAVPWNPAPYPNLPAVGTNGLSTLSETETTASRVPTVPRASVAVACQSPSDPKASGWSR